MRIVFEYREKVLNVKGELMNLIKKKMVNLIKD